MEEYTKYVGIGAGVLTGISMLPQLIKIFRKKEAENISYFMLFILLAGLCGWVWYGILKEDYPIIFTNAFSIVVNMFIIILSIRYKKK